MHICAHKITPWAVFKRKRPHCKVICATFASDILFYCHLYDMVFYQNDIKLYLSKDFLRAFLNNQKFEKVVSDSSAGKSKKTGSDEGANMSISAFIFDCSAKHPLDDFLSTGSSKLTKQSQSPKVAQDGCKQQKFRNYFT